jgi:hypothetical protein
MPAPLGLYKGANRCAVCGTFVRSGVVCPEHRLAAAEPGARPSLADGRTIEYLALGELSVPKTYQREERPQLVRKIVREFDPDLVGVLTVCEGPDGELWLLDGQHRWLALVELGYERAYCEILHDRPVERQAAIFSGRNSKRIAPHPRDAFKADHVAREAAAVAIVATLAKHGYLTPFGVHKASARRFVCVSTLREVHAWGLLDPTLAILNEAWPRDEEATQAAVVAGLAAFQKLYPGVARRELVARLLKHSANEVLRLARARQVNTRERRQWVHVAAIVVEQYNHGRRKVHQLEWSGVPLDAARQWKERSR